MAYQAHHRIYRTRIYILAASIVSVLALFLYMRLGPEPAKIVLEATGTVAITLIVAQYITEMWLWKTKIGDLLGFPPDYSGKWEGKVVRLKNNSEKTPTETKIEVTVHQQLTQIEWNQVGYSETGEKITESHLILGEIVDYHRKWDGIVGIYEVTRENGLKDEGMQLLSVSEDYTEINGMYCGINGNVGTMKLKRKS